MSTGLSILSAWSVIEGQKVRKQRLEGQYLAACVFQGHKHLQSTDIFLKVGYFIEAEVCYESKVQALEFTREFVKLFCQ